MIKQSRQTKKLPMRWVELSRTFTAFRKSGDRVSIMCECSSVALQNFFVKIAEDFLESNSDSASYHALHSIRFHVNTDRITAAMLGDPESMYRQFAFAEKLCHACNKITPDARYCSPMYGSAFKQYWGWYINQEAFKQLFNKNRFIQEQYVSDTVKQLVPTIRALRARWSQMADSSATRDEKRELERHYTKLERKVENEFENIVRVRVGYRPIGSRFVSETLLYTLICELYPANKVERHARPPWLMGLELDVFIPDLRLGFEYQGVQHYQPIEAWGGAKALSELQIRDAKKRALCIQNNVVMVEVRHDEPLSASVLKKKIVEAVQGISV
jgi:hypothetical protein